MYTNLKHVQLLISMLKARAISHVVVSPGNTHNPIVRSLENDEYFRTYNIVDERSAAYFAIGLCQELNEPVVACCTAGTAVSNYLSGVTEAHKRHLPLVVITGDKHPYYLGQHEDQMIDQPPLFRGVTRYACTLPIIRDEDDEWYTRRILNEAYLALDHHGKGPVHINVPIDKGKLAIGSSFTTTALPKFSSIERFDLARPSDPKRLKSVFKSARRAKILFLCGQDHHAPPEQLRLMESVFSKYDCLFATDKLSNLHGHGTLEIARAAVRIKGGIGQFHPDIVISFGGNTAIEFKFILKGSRVACQHWLVADDGKVADPYRKLTTVFEGSVVDFLRVMAAAADASMERHPYYDLWKQEHDRFLIPDFAFSSLYATKELMGKIPPGSLLHLGNSSTIRIAQLFDLHESIEVQCNRGVNGIDGSLSTFIGQSCATDRPCYMILGDLSFFYDMNGIWNRYVGGNIRIMLLNNRGASLFHFTQGLAQYPKLNLNVAAEHFASAKGWAESLGFEYRSAEDKEGFMDSLEPFLSTTRDKPILLEVFTRKEEDARLQHEFYKMNKPLDDGRTRVKQSIKKVAFALLGENQVRRIAGKKGP